MSYLDVTLEHSTYRPYQKENNQVKNINTESNNPRSMITNLRSLSNSDFHHYPHQKKSLTTLLPHTNMP